MDAIPYIKEGQNGEALMNIWNRLVDFANNVRIPDKSEIPRKLLPPDIRGVAMGLDDVYDAIIRQPWLPDYAEYMDIDVSTPVSAIDNIKSIFPLLQYITESMSFIMEKYQTIFPLYENGPLEDIIPVVEEIDSFIKSMKYNDVVLYSQVDENNEIINRGMSFVLRLKTKEKLYAEAVISSESYPIGDVFDKNKAIKELLADPHIVTEESRAKLLELLSELEHIIIGKISQNVQGISGIFDILTHFYTDILENLDEYETYCKWCRQFLFYIWTGKTSNNPLGYHFVKIIATYGLNTLIAMYYDMVTFSITDNQVLELAK